MRFKTCCVDKLWNPENPISLVEYEKILSNESSQDKETCHPVYDHAFMTSTQTGGGGVLKFVTCLWILVFLNNRFIFIFVDGGVGEGGGKKIGNFLWAS